ncbi:MAG TPA: hypothetical protein VHO47_03060 [Candidatus Babeliales bacterium]|nr:hypothetical protein [Candidatus Babeliales bacterium]
MAQNSFFDNENTQFELSYEFLALLKWLVENESENLKKIVARAVRNNFMRDVGTTKNVNPEFVQSSIVDFLELIDTLLLEVSHESRIKKAVEYNLMPAIDQIDTTSCDKSTLQTTLDKATAALEAFPEKNPKDILCAELLKRWKPLKNSQLN